MIKKLRSRFILFTMLVISCIIGAVICIFAYASQSSTTLHRAIILGAIILLLVWLASALLSRAAIRPIREAWERQLRFTADASHELRTPLAVIRSNLEIVQSNGDATVKSQEKWLDNIHKETLRLSTLVEDLLTLSRADSSEYELELTELPLELIVSERAEAFDAMAKEKGVSIVRHVPPELTLVCDGRRIAQLFTILLDNSLKYMGKPGTISIDATQNEREVRIIFSDDGAGLPTAQVPDIFTRFYRADKARAQGGSGLGLAIAKWIVEAHKGSISASGDSGKGLRYEIVFRKA